MKAKDIDDRAVLQFIADNDPNQCVLFERGVSRLSVMWAMPADTPIKVARAKMKALVHRGLVEGWGNFTISKNGKFWLAYQPPVVIH